MFKCSGYTTKRKNVTSCRGSKRLGDQRHQLAGQRDFVIDVASVHDFSGNRPRDEQTITM